MNKFLYIGGNFPDDFGLERSREFHIVVKDTIAEAEGDEVPSQFSVDRILMVSLAEKFRQRIRDERTDDLNKSFAIVMRA